MGEMWNGILQGSGRISRAKHEAAAAVCECGYSLYQQ